MNKKLLTTILVLGVIISVGYFGTSHVLANENTPGYSTLVSRIAQKFNLKENDVEAVFSAVRDERQVEMKAKREESLDKAVQDGVITESQKVALLAKMEEHREARGEKKEAMQKWFSDQGIDASKLRSYLGFGERKGGPGMMMPR